MWSIWLHLAPSADIIPAFEIGEQLTPAIEPDRIAEIVNTNIFWFIPENTDETIGIKSVNVPHDEPIENDKNDDNKNKDDGINFSEIL